MSSLTLGTGLGSLLASLGPLANQYLNQSSTNQANAAGQAGLTAAQNVSLPQLQQLLYTAQQGTAANPYAAAQSAAAQQGANAYNNINLNPAAMAAEQNTLGQLQQIAQNNGLTPQTQAQLAAIRQQGNTNAAGQRGAILQNAQAQGIGNSGLAVAQEMLANQNNANTQALAGQQQAAAQQQMQLGALQGAGQLGGQIYGQQYNQAANQAAAQNAINQQNAQLQQQSGLANQAATNTALNQGVANQQQANLANQNAINTQYQTNAANTLGQSAQQLAQANAITSAGSLAAGQQNLQNKLNTATATPLMNTIFGAGATPSTSTTNNGTTTTTGSSSGQTGLLQNWLTS